MIGAYHPLWRIEKTFRMSKHDLRARPIHHHKHESIEAHLTIVFAALAVTRFVENATGWSIKRFVRTARHRSGSAPTRWPPKSHSRPTYAARRPRSTDEVRTSLSRVRWQGLRSSSARPA